MNQLAPKSPCLASIYIALTPFYYSTIMNLGSLIIYSGLRHSRFLNNIPQRGRLAVSSQNCEFPAGNSLSTHFCAGFCASHCRIALYFQQYSFMGSSSSYYFLVPLRSAISWDGSCTCNSESDDATSPQLSSIRFSSSSSSASKMSSPSSGSESGLCRSQGSCSIKFQNLNIISIV